MEPSTPEHWRIRLDRLLNREEFASASERERLEVLQEALRQSSVSAIDFNRVLVELWHQPKLTPQLFGARLVYLNARRPFVGPSDTFTYRDSEEETADKQFLMEVENFVWNEFSYDAEDLLKPLNELIRGMQSRMNAWAKYPALRRIDYLNTISDWKRRFNTGTRLVKRHRQCHNQGDPWDETPIIEVAENEYLHLSNGMCWNVLSFIEYVRGINGVNDSKGLVGYTSKRLWETEDLERILQHSLVKESGFDVWLKRVLSANSYEIVSIDTLGNLYRLASIFVSRGNPFHKELQNSLTPAQYRAYWQYTNGNSDDLHLIPINQGQEIIREAIKTKMKVDAFEKFAHYYNSLSSDEKTALELAYPGFERDLSFCDAGRLCVYVLAKTAYSIYRRIAEMKGIDPLSLDVSER